ncbi:hypothetical protein KM295_03640 [Natronomonas sp. F2-12]|uniref:Uncharacterized protein n=1 Tax=Natronomonas aquatica TaxID=2841590 RepID=A0A9R1CS02_9EURY|nr:hypothetical protein [Natronomonas aquatica]MCQ4332596.1 hypothetical protein [Natronomonas aquatica]
MKRRAPLAGTDGALAVSDRLAVLSDARVGQVGEPRALYRWPKSRFVADFVGENNVFEGTSSLTGVMRARGKRRSGSETTPSRSPDRRLASRSARGRDAFGRVRYRRRLSHRVTVSSQN